MSVTPSTPGEPSSSGTVEIRRTRQIGDVLATGVVSGCRSDIDLHLEAPYRITVSSPHIPVFALAVRQWMKDGALTEAGEEMVARLFEDAVGLGDAAQANRVPLAQTRADWERQVLPLKQSVEAARENQAKVRHERREAIRDGAAHEAGWQNEVLKPANKRLADAEAALEEAEEEFEARIAEILDLDDELPGGTSCHTVMQLLD